MQQVRPPYLVRKLYRSLVWRIPTVEKKVYLTFDDGPIPDVTPWVLEMLEQYKAKATFFCIGENVEKHPTIYQQIINGGHAVGNHTFNHLKGWKTTNVNYYNNIEKCAGLVSSNLFRPPYGQIKKSQIKDLKSYYSIIMWDVLSYDFDQSISPGKCLSNVLRYTREGSIIVFHDSLKAQSNLKYTLPKLLEHLCLKGFTLKVLE